MKSISQFLFLSAMVIMTMTFGACSDDDSLFKENTLGSQLTERGEYRVSRFQLQRNIVDIPTSEDGVSISMVSHTDNSELLFDALVEHSDDHLWIELLIPRASSIPDSDYDLTFTLKDGSRLGVRLQATFRDEMLYSIIGKTRLYKLDGRGTLEKPYLIGSTDDFLNFRIGLDQDSLRGAGMYFKQTADFTAPEASDAIDGRLYTPAQFAGSYNGANHSITMQYSGSSSSERDNNIGLFATLLEGSVVRNLTVNASIRGGNSCVGAIAGATKGTVALDSIAVKGYVLGKDHVAAFIGQADGNLIANNCFLAASVSATDYVGGLVGSLENGTLTTKMFTNLLPATPEEIKAGGDRLKMHDFTVIAEGSHAGGVAGYVNGGCSMSGVLLQHTIDGETKEVKVIYAGNNYAGGLIGEAIINQTSMVTSIHSLAPITANKNYSGGLIGKASISADMSILSSTIGTQILGGSYVGGFIGHATTGGMLTIGKASNDSQNFIGEVRNAYAAITGKTDVGGLFGYIEGDIKPTSATSINIDVTATDSISGGVIGTQHNNTLECKYFSLDNDMTIYGNKKVGGYVGYANHSTIHGDLNDGKSINAKSHPAFKSFTTTFAGKVKPKNSGYAMGGIVGYAYDTYLSALCVTGSVEGSEGVGGIVGVLENPTRGYIYDCVANLSSLKNVSGDYTGGICGLYYFSSGSQSDLINYTDVTGQNYTGGIFGAIKLLEGAPSMDLNSIFNEGSITGTEQVGGCIGYIEHNNTEDYRKNDVKVSYAGNFSAVESSGVGNVGGIIGHGNTPRMIVMHCANHGNISSKQESKVGGIIGRIGHDAEGASFYIGENIELAYCCNRGEISSESSASNIGGIAGYQEEGHEFDEQHWMTHDCYNAGTLSSDQTDDNGGILGFIDHYGEICQCINIGEVKYGNGIVGTHPAGGIFYYHNVYTLKDKGKDWRAEVFSDADKAKESTFEGFDFSNVWQINDSRNDGFPSLRDCPFQYKD